MDTEERSEDRIEEVGIAKELRDSYLAYSVSVIKGRAIPDARDGLKPVHRRILYAMSELGNTYNRPYKKSARVVGDVIGKYHPHGDSAVYDALVRMAQDFSMRDPLVDGQGNFGSIDGDSPAAMRYTEVRMAKLAGEFLGDIDKDTVDFRPNYDGSLDEPAILPTKVPNLLLNGSSGIAVGMATNIPTHNLGELCDALTALLDNPQATVDDLMQFVKGPDFPTRGEVYAGRGLYEAYHTGRGSIRIRGRVRVEERKKGLESLVIYEIPYGVNKSVMVERIAALVNEKKIEGVTDLRDESDRNGIRVVIDLKKGTIPDIITNALFKYTPLETSFGINMLAVVDNQPPSPSSSITGARWSSEGRASISRSPKPGHISWRACASPSTISTRWCASSAPQPVPTRRGRALRNASGLTTSRRGPSSTCACSASPACSARKLRPSTTAC